MVAALNTPPARNNPKGPKNTKVVKPSQSDKGVHIGVKTSLEPVVAQKQKA
jgi:hypothetical protein